MDLESDSNETACGYTVNGTVLDHEEVEYLCDGGISFGNINAACFALIFVFSVIGNSLLLCTLLRYEDLKRVTNVFILNLACSDVVFTLTLPFWAVDHASHWVFGDFACKFLIAAYFVGIYSSVILLTAMTVDRFATVVVRKWPRVPLRRGQFATAACAGAWVISVVASLSDAIDSKAEDQGDGVFTCEAYSNADSTGVKVGYYLQVSLLFLLPFTIIVFCYSAILRTVLLSAIRKKNRAVMVVLCNVVAFFVCWAPYNLLIFLLSVYETKGCSSQERLNFAVEICRILAYSHCCMNPVLYMLSQKFRRHLLSLFRCDKVQQEEGEQENNLGQSTSYVIQNAAVKDVKNAAQLELQSIQQ